MVDDLAPRPAESGPDSLGPGLPPGAVLLEQDFDADSLYVLRAAVSAHGAEAGLDRGRLYDVVAVAHELAANAVRHGAGRGHLRLWRADGLLHCQVTDAGRDDPAGGGKGDTAGGGKGSDPGQQDRAASAGQAADGDGASRLPWREEHGHGLWVVARVADQFRIDRDGATVATAAFALGAPHGPAD